jgi:hypothetical protein
MAETWLWRYNPPESVNPALRPFHRSSSPGTEDGALRGLQEAGGQFDTAAYICDAVSVGS